MRRNACAQLRQEKRKQQQLTKEQVYQHYHPNEQKAKDAIDFAVEQNRKELNPIEP